MKRKLEDNTVFVLQKAVRKFKIKVTDTSLREFLLAHPYYPSLKSVCDALKKWGIEHYALNLEIDEIKDLEMPFIAHLKSSELVFIEKIKKENVFYSAIKGENKNEKFLEFAKKLSGAVIVLENTGNAGEKDYKLIRQNEILNNILLPFGVLTILFIGLLNFSKSFGDSVPKYNLIFGGLTITKFTGIIASLLLVMHEFKIKSSITDKICSFSSKTGCGEVLDSNASRLFGWLNWADAGLVYFIGTLFYLLGSVGNSSLGFLAIISLFSMPYPLFSIYYQSLILKKWCPFCVLVQMVLITEFILLFPIFKIIVFQGNDSIRLINSFFVPAALILLYRAYYSKLISFKINQYSFLQFKRNAEVFEFLLKKNDYTEITEDKNSLILGLSDAPVTMTAFLSLYCEPCAKAFKQLQLLLQNCTEIKINVIFSVYNDDDTLKAINMIYHLQSESGTEATLNFLNNWYSMAKPLRKSLFTIETIPEKFNTVQISQRNNKLFEKYKIDSTPKIFVNGHLFPKQYKYNDTQYYIETILQLTRDKKRQEACTISN